MRITFVGDTHGNYKVIKDIIELEKPDIVIQAGDFGIWPGLSEEASTFQPKVPVYFCRGNHEWHDELDKLPRGEISEMCNLDTFPNMTNVFHCDSGSILEINGYSILFMGGALSIDKHLRKEGESWWPQELMSDKDLDNILDKLWGKKIDIVVSHTCPEFIVNKALTCLPTFRYGKCDDPTPKQLEKAYHHLEHNPLYWVFGHWHTNTNTCYDGIPFIGLDMNRSGDTLKDIYKKLGFYYTVTLEDRDEQDSNHNRDTGTKDTEDTTTTSEEVQG